MKRKPQLASFLAYLKWNWVSKLGLAAPAPVAATNRRSRPDPTNSFMVLLCACPPNFSAFQRGLLPRKFCFRESKWTYLGVRTLWLDFQNKMSRSCLAYLEIICRPVVTHVINGRHTKTYGPCFIICGRHVIICGSSTFHLWSLMVHVTSSMNHVYS